MFSGKTWSAQEPSFCLQLEFATMALLTAWVLMVVIEAARLPMKRKYTASASTVKHWKSVLVAAAVADRCGLWWLYMLNSLVTYADQIENKGKKIWYGEVFAALPDQTNIARL